MHTLGQKGEDLTTQHYLSLGFKLVDRNYKAPFGKQTGEIDLIFAKDSQLVFVEVKTRSSGKFGSAFEAVDVNKQRKLVRTAKLYIQLHPKWQQGNYRIDVAAVDVDNLLQPVIILMNAIEDID